MKRVKDFSHSTEPNIVVANAHLRAGRTEQALRDYVELLRSRNRLLPQIVGNLLIARRRLVRNRVARGELRTGIVIPEASAAWLESASQVATRYQVRKVGLISTTSGVRAVEEADWPAESDLLLDKLDLARDDVVLDRVLELVAQRPYDVLRVCRWTLGAMMISIIYKLLWGSEIIVQSSEGERAGALPSNDAVNRLFALDAEIEHPNVYLLDIWHELAPPSTKALQQATEPGSGSKESSDSGAAPNNESGALTTFPPCIDRFLQNIGDRALCAMAGVRPRNKLDAGKTIRMSDLDLVAKSKLFDWHWYIYKHNIHCKDRDQAIEHFMQYGASQLLDPCPVFDVSYYLAQIPWKEKPLTQNPLAHYLTGGWKKYDPNRFFDTAYYLSLYSDCLAGLSPLEHYVTSGHQQGCQPSPIFINDYYYELNPDVRAAGINPLWHYLSSGQREKRSFVPLEQDVASYRVLQVQQIKQDDHVLVFVAFCPDGLLTPLQEYMLQAYEACGYKVILAVNSGAFADLRKPYKSFSGTCIVRENVGYDFGAWAAVCRVFASLNAADTVTFTNDSTLLAKGADQIAIMRQRIATISADVVALTLNREITDHYQSYFFTLKTSAIESGALSILSSLPYLLAKQGVIDNYELNIWSRFREKGLTIRDVFSVEPAEKARKNPTIHFWRELIEEGFPFIKVQLFSLGLLSIDDARLPFSGNEEYKRLIQAHLRTRNTSTEAFDPKAKIFVRPQWSLPDSGRFGEYRQLNARNPSDAAAFPVELPIQNLDRADFESARQSSVLAVIHCFYTDVAARILSYMHRLNTCVALKIICTTDSPAKAKELTAHLRDLDLDGDVVIAPNRGRDVAPLLIEGARYMDGFEYILHLHTKRSPHSSVYAGWADFLFENLIGSIEIAVSILALLRNGDVGFVFSEHYPAVKGLRNWGFDFTHAKALLERCGIRLSNDDVLEFPTSTMFWARTEAIRPVFDLGLKYTDFEEEAGQIDGTLAHAIERSLLYITEAEGFRWRKVVSSRAAASARGWRLCSHEMTDGLMKGEPLRLVGSSAGVVVEGVPELYEVFIKRSHIGRPRLNILIPTLKPEKIYGGVSSALKAASSIAASFRAQIDVRILVTSDPVCWGSMREAGLRLSAQCVRVCPGDDIAGWSVVDLHSYVGSPVAIREKDIFFATAWWTADLGDRLRTLQRGAFGVDWPILYLIQDYEPGFYAWSARSALARATYAMDKMVALINSEELAQFMMRRFVFWKAWYLPYQLNEVLAAKREARPKEKMILVYGRPSVERNLFNLIVSSLKRWQGLDPVNNCAYQIVFAGEDFPESMIAGLENAQNVGKASLENYADLLNRAAVGVSLMESPHPSYPPLEMASFGLIVVTNAYEGKDLGKRSKNVISLSELSMVAMVDALEQALDRSAAPKGAVGASVDALACDLEKFDATVIAAAIEDWVEGERKAV